jgi:plasmid maintenance system antidote protein VapI
MSRVTEAVRECLTESGMTLRGFAKKLGVSAAYLSDVKLGNRRMSDRMAARLADHRPKRTVREWRLMQMDDEIDTMKAERNRLAND